MLTPSANGKPLFFFQGNGQDPVFHDPYDIVLPGIALPFRFDFLLPVGNLTAGCQNRGIGDQHWHKVLADAPDVRPELPGNDNLHAFALEERYDRVRFPAVAVAGFVPLAPVMAVMALKGIDDLSSGYPAFFSQLEQEKLVGIPEVLAFNSVLCADGKSKVQVHGRL